MPLEFSVSMFDAMEEFIGQHRIFGYGVEAIDSDRRSGIVPHQFGRRATPSCPSFAVGECNMPMLSNPQLDANAAPLWDRWAASARQ